ncbi:MAG: efflux RND transporter periplasmic adaptor subunit [Bacteroidales bacterium]|nr:efflux RND transporter periplasmic adaptor subunit [Bacteroidales bacterium]MDD4669461.1 efflux RND transporter periplasmic adaptor subunit [Bacteroidales bacterium]
MRKQLMVIALVTLCVVTSCKTKEVTKDVTPIVKVENVQAYGANPQSSFPGKIKANSDINIAFKVSGTIRRVAVREGSFVKKGDLLVEMDPRDYQIQFSATEAEYNQIKGEAERVISLYEKNSVSQNDYEKAKYGLEQITAKYNAHRNALQDTKLRAPYDGFVQKIIYSANETVSAGMPVVTMVGSSTPEVEINIPAGDYYRRNDFQSFYCTIDLFKGEKYPLELMGINKKANANQLFTAYFRMSIPKGLQTPTPGMAATVVINYKDNSRMQTIIPISALLSKGDTSMVWVYDEQNQSVGQRRVSGLEFCKDGKVIVSEGISQGDKIVTAGVHSLSDGMKVKLLPQKSTTNVGGLL